jgi:hypothetical protein
MYYRLNDKEQNVLKEVEEITNTNYCKIDCFVIVSEFMNALVEMLYEYKNKCEELENLKNDLEENYVRKPIDYGVSDRDFI